MNKTNKQVKLWLSLVLCTVLIAALALCTVGCQDSGEKENPQNSGNTATTATDAAEATTKTDANASGTNVKGEGNTVFYFEVVDGDGNTERFEIHTDKTLVGDALMDLGLISGEDGDYGLYVKTVNGITADYETNGTYWAFYVNGEYGMTGVDMTEITPGAMYAFKVSK